MAARITRTLFRLKSSGMEHPDQIRYHAIKLFENGQHQEAVSMFDRLIAVSDYTGDYAWRAQSLVALGRYRDALDDCELAMSKDPADPSAFTTAAFILSATPPEELRDGSAALDLIRHALETTDTPSNWRINSIAAAVHAECGDFAQAERYATMCANDSPPEMAQRFRERIQQYRDGIPYRASAEDITSASKIRDVNCMICGAPAFMRWPPRDPNRQPRCVDCCSYDTSESAE